MEHVRMSVLTLRIYLYLVVTVLTYIPVPCSDCKVCDVVVVLLLCRESERRRDTDERAKLSVPHHIHSQCGEPTQFIGRGGRSSEGSGTGKFGCEYHTHTPVFITPCCSPHPHMYVRTYVHLCSPHPHTYVRTYVHTPLLPVLKCA